jgi:protein-L-isoaspartate(D-aspartate) O-methyltransferase
MSLFSHHASDVASSHPRMRMIASQLVARGIQDGRVLDAMLEVPRETFVPEDERSSAYYDSPQPVGCGQTISQPYIVARMLELAELRPDDRALEVGTGTGYEAALLGRLVKSVVTIERHGQLAEAAKRNIEALGLGNVEVRTGDGTTGAPDRAPFDVIVIAAGGPKIPPTLLAQLAPGGRLICPVGDKNRQQLVRARRSTSGERIACEELDPVMFVPLIGAEGWSSGRAG